MTERIALVLEGLDAAELQEFAASQIVIEPHSSHSGRPLQGVIRWATASRRSERHSKQHFGMISHLREAIAEHRLTVEYQAQFDLQTGMGIGVEALARWIPRKEKVSPSVFIPLAERTGLIAALGTAVLELACEAVMPWQGPQELARTLSVNVSAHQVDTAFCDALEQILVRTGFDPRRLELEITESALFADEPLALVCLARWRELGVRIALDDFGVGYCNLSHLSKISVDRIKLDQYFVRGVVADPKTAAIVNAVIGLGRDLGIDVLAEGVETEAQLHALLAMGCRQAQGYLLAPPVRIAAARTLIDTPWGRRKHCDGDLNRKHNEDCHAS